QVLVPVGIPEVTPLAAGDEQGIRRVERAGARVAARQPLPRPAEKGVRLRRPVQIGGELARFERLERMHPRILPRPGPGPPPRHRRPPATFWRHPLTAADT